MAEKSKQLPGLPLSLSEREDDRRPDDSRGRARVRGIPGRLTAHTLTAMSERDRIIEVANVIAKAIGKRDVQSLARAMAQGFVHRSPGGDAVDAENFLRAIEQIPGEILSVTLEAIDVDVSGSGALATGIQHAQLRLDGTVIDDRRAFVDWFINVEGEWRILVAVDLPAPSVS